MKVGVEESSSWLPALTAANAPIYGLWIQTGAIVISAISVILTIIWMNLIARRRATLDIVLKEQTDPRLIEKRSEFVILRNAGHLAQWADPKKATGPEAVSLRVELNRYELVSIGTKRGTLDEKSYKEWCRTTLVKDWMACKGFVMELRHNTGSPTYFCEFEALAKKWTNGEESKHV